jgi:hypothetical protein
VGKLVKTIALAWLAWVAWLYYRDNIRTSYRPG